MEILEFLGGQKFFMILGLFVVLVVLFNKLRTRNYHKASPKKKK